MKRNLIFAAVGAVLGISIWGCLSQNRLDDNKLDDNKAAEIANWLRASALKPGENSNVRLPPQFDGLTARGLIEIVFKKKDKLAYFLKSTEGYKGNYRGYVYVDSGFSFSIRTDHDGREIMGISDYGADPYIIVDKKISNNLYAVFSNNG